MTENIAVTEAELKNCIEDLNEIVGQYCKGSVLRGLDVVSVAFAATLDIYSQPNAENPEGMCDDYLAFRKVYADAIMRYPLLEAKFAMSKPDGG